jgi:hypothetical protein
LRTFDDESVTEEPELVKLLVALLLEPVIDAVVELGEFRTPLDTTPSPTTIIIAITTIATILEEIALAALAILTHPAKEVAGAISDYASALLSTVAKHAGGSYSLPLSAVTTAWRFGSSVSF